MLPDQQTIGRRYFHGGIDYFERAPEIAKVSEAAAVTARATSVIHEREADLVVKRAAEAERVAEAQCGSVVRRAHRKHNGERTLVPQREPLEERRRGSRVGMARGAEDRLQYVVGRRRRHYAYAAGLRRDGDRDCVAAHRDPGLPRRRTPPRSRGREQGP